jgi:hypothetical protein
MHSLPSFVLHGMHRSILIRKTLSLRCPCGVVDPALWQVTRASTWSCELKSMQGKLMASQQAQLETQEMLRTLVKA